MEELIEKAKNQDKEAFTKLVLNSQKELYAIAKIRLREEEEICDVMQDTMLLAYKNLQKLKENKYFKTWLIRILINECNKAYKRKYRWVISFEEEIMENVPQKEESNLDFDFLIKNLSNKEQTILTLYYSFEYTTKDIGKILGIKEATIRSKIARAKNKIKKEYKEEVE